MNEYIYINNNSNVFSQLEENIFSNYRRKDTINLSEVFNNEEKTSQYKIDNYIEKTIDDLSHGDRLIVQELKTLGNSNNKILKKINRALVKHISIFSVNEDLLISHENQTLYSMISALLNASELSKNKRLIDAKKTRKKNGTKLGRAGGKKTKSMFDKHKKKIKKLSRQGLSKVRILDEIKKDDPKLKHTSPQALGQYMKRIEEKKTLRSSPPKIKLEYSEDTDLLFDKNASSNLSDLKFMSID